MFTWKLTDSAELRLWEDHLVEECFAVVDRNREHLDQWLPWVEKTRTPDDTRAFVRRALEQFARNEGFHAAIIEDGKIVGGIGFLPVDWTNKSVEIGYWLAEAAQGKGLMTTAVRALAWHAFDVWKLHRVFIRAAVGNTRSCAVPLRLGFAHEGILREAYMLHEKFISMNIYGILDHEWRARHGPAPQPAPSH